MSIITEKIRLATVAVLLSAALGLSAQSVYMLIPGIKGESTNKAHADWIDLQSISGCIANDGIKSATSCEISISKNIDLSTTGVYSNLLTGKGTGASKVLVDVCGTNGSGMEFCYYKLELNFVSFTSASNSGSGGGSLASESWTLNFRAIKWTYIPRWQTTPGAPVSQCWDFASGSAVCP